MKDEKKPLKGQSELLKANEEVSEDEKIEYKPLHASFYPYTAVKEISNATGAVILRLNHPFGGFLWLPYDAFSEQYQFKSALELIRSN